MTSEQTAEYIRALLEERRGYEAFGNAAGIAEVDAELSRVGHKAKTPRKRAERMSAPERTEL
jgi:hypothetical protein